MPIVYHHNGVARKVIGTLDPDRKIFSKKVQSSKHLMRILDAWGTDAEYFKKVLLPGGYTLKFVDVEDKVRYWVSAERMNEFGIYKHFLAGKHNYGAQIFLPREYWTQVPYESTFRSSSGKGAEPEAEPVSEQV